MSEIHKTLTALGFKEVETGGGCTAYKADAEVLITTESGGSSPTSLEEPIPVGAYVNKTGNTVMLETHASLADYIATLRLHRSFEDSLDMSTVLADIVEDVRTNRDEPIDELIARWLNRIEIAIRKEIGI